MKYFANIHNADELRKAYRAHVITMHPDRGGNEEEFKAMQAEFETLKKQYQNGTAYTYESRHTETAEERARREAEEAREREEWARWEAEEKARQEQEKREEAERIRKAQEESRAAVRAWAQILERIPATVSGKKRAYDFTDKKACAAYIAATKRNIKAVINHYFPGLDVKVTISGEIWKEKFSIAWEDGPTADELRETCKELEFFVPSYYTSDPYADYGEYRERKESAPWREAYGGGLGDATDYDTARTLSEEGEEQAANIAAGIFADFDPAKLHKTNEQFKMTLTEWHKFAELCKIDGVIRHFENLIRCYSGNNEGMAYYSSLRRYLRDYVKVSVTKKEKAPEFRPTYGPTLKAIKKALGGNVFAKMQETKRRENDWTPCDFSVLLGDLQGVKLCKPYSYDMETYYSPVYFTSYKTESTRREKFEAVGITMNGASVKAVREDVAAKIREELDDIEKQRQQWKQEQTAKASEKTDNGKKAAKTDNSKQDSKQADSDRDGVDMTAAPAEGLRLIETADGVAVVADDWKTTYFNKKYIKAHGAHWNKERKQWEATEPQDVDALRAWFFFHGKPTDQGATIDDVTTEEEGDTATASAPADNEQGDTLENGQDITDTTTDTTDESEPEAADLSPVLQAFADVLRIFADIMQQAKQWEGVTVPAATLARWKQEATEGTKTAAARLCEVCACLASLTPDSRRDFDALGAIFWSLSEQIRNGCNPDTLQAATDYARAQLFDLIDRTQNENQARAVREANGESDEQRKAA
jgi:hypothetical protein